ncbi:MAG: hypothetical protein H6622_17470 [Halobacteriovoraceae bacterium]|nr:hypothetical protein [Halobacteriovoraceae bacterium]
MALQNQFCKLSDSVTFSNTTKKKLFESLDMTLKNSKIGFFRLNDFAPDEAEYVRLLERFEDKKHFVLLGIGGSSLGPKMILSALPKKRDISFHFIDNVDPDEFYATVSAIDLKKTLFYVVSKSGDTIETLSCLVILKNLLNDAGISESQYKDYFLFCTENNNGQLNNLSKKWNIQSIEIPQNIGGRFSVLTAVGMIPTIFAGHSVKAFFDGAQEIIDEFYTKQENSDIIHQSLILKYFYDKKINETVLMPYSSRLKSFSDWFVQLWAESLGKEKDRDNQTVEIGLTPIAAVGASDQHSQMQLFMDGPRNKYIFFIGIDNFSHDFSLENDLDGNTFELISPHGLSHIIHAELRGTMRALEQKGRPFNYLRPSELNEHNIGAMILYFETLTAAMGEVFNINAFDQPGVALGKKTAVEILLT